MPCTVASLSSVHATLYIIARTFTGIEYCVVLHNMIALSHDKSHSSNLIGSPGS